MAVEQRDSAPQPFVIRGRHLEIFARALLYGPEEIDYLTGIMLSATETMGVGFYQDYEYMVDVLGHDLNDSGNYKRKLKNAFLAFLALDDGDPVQIKANARDGICRACTFGNHCGEDTSDIDNPEIVRIFGAGSRNGGVTISAGELKKILRRKFD